MIAVSAAAHVALLIWVLHPPEPLLLNPYSVRVGRNGTSLTRLYWSGRMHDEAKGSSPDSATEVYRHQRYVSQRLVLQNSPLAKLPPPTPPPEVEPISPAATISNRGHSLPAGLPYGTLARGAAFGDEIRPALPIATSDPVVYPWQLPNIAGNEIIEITIDEEGNITRKTVLHSLGPDIDEKCLAALDNWRFHPATHNGIAIPSKQDAIFPFKARG
ncbi:MAG TPA: energy transducer TonB [Candidatus Aquilonibacter sp.]|nr:energy transducer TonB [Candidatus Aquilonibacter sp.]